MLQKLIVIIIVLAATFITATTFAQHVNSTLIPRKVLFATPDKVNVTLSRDGKYIGYLAPKDGVLNIWIADSKNLANAKAITDDKDRGVRSYFWMYDNKHIMYFKDNDGNENFRLYSYNLQNNDTKLLTPENGVTVVIYGRSSNKPNEIAISLNQRNKRYFDLYRLNLVDYSKTLIMENNKFTNFIVDHDLNLRFALLRNSKGDKEYWHLKIISGFYS